MSDANPDKLKSVAEAMRLVAERDRLRVSFRELWAELFPTIPTSCTLSLLSRWAQEASEEKVRHWITQAYINEVPGHQVCRYVNEKRRNSIREEADRYDY